MNYSEILKRSFRITWKHRALWIFGALLALFSAGRGGTGGGQNLIASGTPPSGAPTDLDLFLQPRLIISLAAIAIGIAFMWLLVGFVVRYISRGALIGMVAEIEAEGSTAARSGLRIGANRALPLFGISAILFVPLSIITVVMLGVALAPLLLLFIDNTGIRVASAVLTGGLMLIIVIVLLFIHAAVSLLREFIDRQCVIEGKGVFESIEVGIDTARANLRESIFMWLLLLGVGLVWGIVLIPIILAATAVVIGPAVAVYGMTQRLLPTILVGGGLGLLALVAIAFVNGLYQTFRHSAWTLAYLELVPRE